MNLHEVKLYLEEKGYIHEEKGKFSFTQAFYNDLDKDSKKSITGAVMGPEFDRKLLTPGEVYKRFLEDARIPRMKKNSEGKTYITGGFTKTGAKALDSLLKKGYEYKILCQAALTYYTETDYCTKIEKILGEGIIITYYDQIKKDGFKPKKTPASAILGNKRFI